MSTAIWWIRRDLRLFDNPALEGALAHAGHVVPAFVLDPAILDSPYVGPKRVAFLWAGLRQLDADLRERGGRLIVRQGVPEEALALLVSEAGADAIFATRDHSPYARARDTAVARRLPIRLLDGPTLRAPGDILKADGAPYTVFTPYSRRWRGLPRPTGTVARLPHRIETPGYLESLSVPHEPAPSPDVLFKPGEVEARRRLAAFVGGEEPPIARYADRRDRIDERGTAMLSPYLRFGMLSARQAVSAALDAMDRFEDAAQRYSADRWLDELIWREFFVSVLYHFPRLLSEGYREEARAVRWEDDDDTFAAWCAGRTGYPIIDAAMRQLSREGWIHNRARMIAASFLVKDLLIDWRLGERYFRHHLIDGDPAANNGGWQWVAGTGTDAMPYFRIFSPVLQGKKHDPAGTWVRRWVPELARVPARWVHEPWKMDDQAQRAAECVIGQDYPAPIVDHQWARGRALAAYRAARSEPGL